MNGAGHQKGGNDEVSFEAQYNECLKYMITKETSYAIYYYGI
jgi:hypothetical protein